DLTTVLQNAIDDDRLPESDDSPTLGLYAVVTPPGIRCDDPKLGGFNAFTYEADPPFTDLDDENYAWIGGGMQSNFDIDTYTSFMSHELTEAISNPDTLEGLSGGFQIVQRGFHIAPPSNPLPKENQISDYEAQSYTYRIHSARFLTPTKVQSYWSDEDQAF